MLEGDCDYQATAESQATVTLVADSTDPLIDLSWVGSVGQIVTDEESYYSLMEELNFGSWLIVDFSTQFVAAMFYDPTSSCDVYVEDWWINETTDGGLALEAQFYDSALNCPDSCGLDTQSVLIVAIEAQPNLKMCRRVRPGCEPG